MKFLPTTFSAVLLLTGSSSAFCQATDAARYVNAQGIEVIQARRPVTPPEPVVQAPKAGAVLKNAAAPIVANGDSKLQVSAKEQRNRDQDRLVILTEELATESKAFENKIKIMQTPAMRSKLSSDELARLQETMVDHEKNMRSLNAEISRAREGR